MNSYITTPTIAVVAIIANINEKSHFASWGEKNSLFALLFITVPIFFAISSGYNFNGKKLLCNPQLKLTQSKIATITYVSIYQNKNDFFCF